MGLDYLLSFGDTGQTEGRSTESYETLCLRNNSIHYRALADWMESCLGHGEGVGLVYAAQPFKVLITSRPDTLDVLGEKKINLD